MRPMRRSPSLDRRRACTVSSQRCAAALDAPVHRRGAPPSTLARIELAQLLRVDDRLAVDREHAVARAQAGARAPAPPAMHLAEHRLAARRADADLAHQLRVDVARARARASGERARARWPRPSRVASRAAASVSPSQRRLRELPAQVGRTSARRAMRRRRRDAARTQSPARRPARSATLPAAGRAEDRLRLLDADPVDAPRRAATASSRLAIGPAATMAARCHSGLRLKARWRSAGATGAFALVEHAHVAAERQRADDELGVRPASRWRPPAGRGRSRPRSAAPSRRRRRRRGSGRTRGRRSARPSVDEEGEDGQHDHVRQARADAAGARRARARRAHRASSRSLERWRHPARARPPPTLRR